MPVRGIRGAITVEADQPKLILQATRTLLEEIIAANPTLRSEDVVSVFFTSTQDLVSTFPAEAAREMGWDYVPLLCAHEIPVPGRLPQCIRVLLHWNTDLPQESIRHIYLENAVSLRPDLNGRNIAQ